MRRRITFIQHQDSSFEPHQATLDPKFLSIRNLIASREDRLTVSFDELPPELSQVLKQCHRLHIRWTTEHSHDTLAPFSSRLTPGLHVHFTPSEPEKPTEELCSLLKSAFGNELDCAIPEVSFTTPPSLPSKEFTPSHALQYHSLLPSLQSFVEFAQGTLCGTNAECRDRAASLLSAESIDINYDGLTHSVTLSGLWSSPEGGWTEDIRSHDTGTEKVEVGILGCEKAAGHEQLKAGGLLAVVGEDEKLKPTLFSFPSRHHALPKDATYTVSFPPPTGMHPTMTISLSQPSLKSPHEPCSLYSYLTLPSSIFGDKYQLSTTDPLFLQSHNLAGLRALAGDTDLEAPDWVVPSWGSTWLFELATPPSDNDQTPEEEEEDNWNITIPLHLRYLRPSESGYRSISIPWPVVFWACPADEETVLTGNPWDRMNLGWEALFAPQTMFHQVHSSSSSTEGRLIEELRVPVLRLGQDDSLFSTKSIELGTVLVITLGLVWVLWKLGSVVRNPGTSAGARTRQQKEKKSE